MSWEAACSRRRPRTSADRLQEWSSNWQWHRAVPGPSRAFLEVSPSSPLARYPIVHQFLKPERRLEDVYQDRICRSRGQAVILHCLHSTMELWKWLVCIAISGNYVVSCRPWVLLYSKDVMRGMTLFPLWPESSLAAYPMFMLLIRVQIK